MSVPVVGIVGITRPSPCGPCPQITTRCTQCKIQEQRLWIPTGFLMDKNDKENDKENDNDVLCMACLITTHTFQFQNVPVRLRGISFPPQSKDKNENATNNNKKIRCPNMMSMTDWLPELASTIKHECCLCRTKYVVRPFFMLRESMLCCLTCFASIFGVVSTDTFSIDFYPITKGNGLLPLISSSSSLAKETELVTLNDFLLQLHANPNIHSLKYQTSVIRHFLVMGLMRFRCYDVKTAFERDLEPFKSKFSCTLNHWCCDKPANRDVNAQIDFTQLQYYPLTTTKQKLITTTTEQKLGASQEQNQKDCMPCNLLTQNLLTPYTVMVVGYYGQDIKESKNTTTTSTCPGPWACPSSFFSKMGGDLYLRSGRWMTSFFSKLDQCLQGTISGHEYSIRTSLESALNKRFDANNQDVREKQQPWIRVIEALVLEYLGMDRILNEMISQWQHYCVVSPFRAKQSYFDQSPNQDCNETKRFQTREAALSLQQAMTPQKLGGRQKFDVLWDANIQKLLDAIPYGFYLWKNGCLVVAVDATIDPANSVKKYPQRHLFDPMQMFASSIFDFWLRRAS
jgi:hypothetical protein